MKARIADQRDGADDVPAREGEAVEAEELVDRRAFRSFSLDKELYAERGQCPTHRLSATTRPTATPRRRRVAIAITATSGIQISRLPSRLIATHESDRAVRHSARWIP